MLSLPEFSRTRKASPVETGEAARVEKIWGDLKKSLAYKTNSESKRDSLIWEITNIERTLLSSMGNLGKQLLDMARTWQDVKASLADGEIAIEYCYAPRMEHYPDVQPYYGAFVIRKDFDYPVLVSLENVDSVEAVFDNIESDALLINELYASKIQEKYLSEEITVPAGEDESAKEAGAEETRAAEEESGGTEAGSNAV